MNNKQAKRLRKIALSYQTADDIQGRKVYRSLKDLYKKGVIKTKTA